MGLSEPEIEQRVQAAAEFTGLSASLLDKSPFDLSGGEKRRAAIAGVIAMDPDVLILDEPTAGLDPRGRDVLLSQIMNYHERRQNTVILVSHSMEDIARVAAVSYTHLPLLYGTGLALYSVWRCTRRKNLPGL